MLGAPISPSWCFAGRCAVWSASGQEDVLLVWVGGEVGLLRRRWLLFVMAAPFACPAPGYRVVFVAVCDVRMSSV
jgi:hypothetical protein